MTFPTCSTRFKKGFQDTSNSTENTSLVFIIDTYILRVGSRKKNYMFYGFKRVRIYKGFKHILEILFIFWKTFSKRNHSLSRLICSFAQFFIQEFSCIFLQYWSDVTMFWICEHLENLLTFLLRELSENNPKWSKFLFFL